jgi:type III pantothenate kinase
MLLAINVGNTNTSLGLADRGGWRARWRLETAPRRTADEYGVLVTGLFGLSGVAPAQVRRIAIASVVPALTPVFTALSGALFGLQPLVVGPGSPTGLDVRYDPPASLGTDRLLDAVAARALAGAPVVAVDLGTATTLNVVDRHGAFIGGAIAPGLGVAAEALVAAGARLRAVDLAGAEAPPLVGRTTEQSLRAGVLYGYAGLVDGLLRRVAEELARRGEPAAPVVATGGFASTLAPLVPRIGRVVPELTLDGLRLVHELATGASAWTR